MDNVQIIILAAGQSKRMGSDDPKALAMFRGKPFLQHILETLSGLNLSIKPVIVVGHKKERIKEVLGHDHNYAEQKTQLGTGDAVKSAKGSVHPAHKIVLVISADQPIISRETISRIIVKHLEAKPAITIATVLLPDFEDWRKGLRHFGRIVRGADGKVKNIIEFRDALENEKLIREVNPAVYAFDSDWLWENIDKLNNENAHGEYYLTELIKIACDQGKDVEAVPVFNILEGLQPNTKEELKTLEKVAR